MSVASVILADGCWRCFSVRGSNLRTLFNKLGQACECLHSQSRLLWFVFGRTPSIRLLGFFGQLRARIAVNVVNVVWKQLLSEASFGNEFVTVGKSIILPVLCFQSWAIEFLQLWALLRCLLWHVRAASDVLRKHVRRQWGWPISGARHSTPKGLPIPACNGVKCRKTKVRDGNRKTKRMSTYPPNIQWWKKVLLWNFVVFGWDAVTSVFSISVWLIAWYCAVGTFLAAPMSLATRLAIRRWIRCGLARYSAFLRF